MHCPFCSTDETKVIDSRLVAEGAQVRRRRECLSCTERFTTYEAAELVLPEVHFVPIEKGSEPTVWKALRAAKRKLAELEATNADGDADDGAEGGKAAPPGTGGVASRSRSAVHCTLSLLDHRYYDSPEEARPRSHRHSLLPMKGNARSSQCPLGRT